MRIPRGPTWNLFSRRVATMEKLPPRRKGKNCLPFAFVRRITATTFRVEIRRLCSAFFYPQSYRRAPLTRESTQLKAIRASAECKLLSSGESGEEIYSEIKTSPLVSTGKLYGVSEFVFSNSSVLFLWLKHSYIVTKCLTLSENRNLWEINCCERDSEELEIARSNLE